MTPEQIESDARDLFEAESTQWDNRIVWRELHEESRQWWRYQVVKRQARAEALEDAAEEILRLGGHGHINYVVAVRALKEQPPAQGGK